MLLQPFLLFFVLASPVLFVPSDASCPFLHGSAGHVGRESVTREEAVVLREKLLGLLRHAGESLERWLSDQEETDTTREAVAEIGDAVYEACNQADLILRRHRLPHSPTKSANIKLQAVACLRLGLAMVEWERGAAQERVRDLLSMARSNALEIDPDYDGALGFASLLPRAADAFASLLRESGLEGRKK